MTAETMDQAGEGKRLGRGSAERVTRRARRRMAGAAVTVAVVAGGGVAMADAAPVPPSDVAADARSVVLMRLDCAGRDGDVASVGCRWSIPADAVGYRLVRVALGSDAGRITIARLDEAATNHYVDSPVRRGVRYLYAVRAVGVDGRTVGASRPVFAGVPVPDDDPAIEALRLTCAATSATAVRCAAGVPTVPARTVTLWRSVDGADRERVASFAAPFPSSYGDQVPTGTTQVHYAVIATDHAGEIVARSRAEHVVMPEREPARTEVGPSPTPDTPVVVEAAPNDAVLDDTSPDDTSPDDEAPPGPASTRPEPRDDVDTQRPTPTDVRPPVTAPPVRDVPARDVTRDTPVRDVAERETPGTDRPGVDAAPTPEVPERTDGDEGPNRTERTGAS